MLVYKMLMRIKGQGFLSLEETKKWWSIHMNEQATVIKAEEDCEEYGIVYAKVYDLNEMSMKKVLKILHKKLPAQETKEICEQNEWLNKCYHNYLRGILKK